MSTHFCGENLEPYSKGKFEVNGLLAATTSTKGSFSLTRMGENYSTTGKLCCGESWLCVLTLKINGPSFNLLRVLSGERATA